MDKKCTFRSNLADSVTAPEEGILSKPVFTDDHLRVTLFGISAGEEMAEHTTTMEALVEVLEGHAVITLDGQEHEAHGGAWIRMAPNLPHAIKAVTPVKMLLTVLRKAKA